MIIGTTVRGTRGTVHLARLDGDDEIYVTAVEYDGCAPHVRTRYFRPWSDEHLAVLCLLQRAWGP